MLTKYFFSANKTALIGHSYKISLCYFSASRVLNMCAGSFALKLQCVFGAKMINDHSSGHNTPPLLPLWIYLTNGDHVT